MHVSIHQRFMGNYHQCTESMPRFSGVRRAKPPPQAAGATKTPRPRLRDSPFWTWCMFTWGFCFIVPILVLLMEFSKISEKLPLNWQAFTTFYSTLATFMMLVSSIIYPYFFTCSTCSREIGCTVMSFMGLFLHASEAWLVWKENDDMSGYLSTFPGFLKTLETCVACIIFVCVGDINYHKHPGLQWCFSVYSICFIFALIVIFFDIGRGMCLAEEFKKFLLASNTLAVLMYMTAVVIWPLYTLRNNPKPSNSTDVNEYSWDNYAVISFMTCFNLVAYIVDTIRSFSLDLD